MDLSFLPLTLDAMDGAAAESLCLFIASDERPLTGLAGLADWRLSGRLSRLLRSGVLTGEAGEAVLTPPGARLGFRKLFLFGVGPADQPEEALADRIAEALRKLGQAGVQEAAMQLPSRLSADAGIRALVSENQGPARATVFGPDPQKYVAALGHVARRASAPPPPRPAAPSGRPAVKPALPQQQAPVPAIPKASPLPFAPQPSAPPAIFTPPPTAPAIPETPAPPVAPPAPATPPPPVAPRAPSTPPPPATQPAEQPPVPAGASGERKPVPPSQRYVPPPPKPHVFEKKKRRK
jgi:hypothetical protein